MIVIQHDNFVLCQIMGVSSIVCLPKIVFASYHWKGVYLTWTGSVHDPVTLRDDVTWVFFLSCYWGWWVLDFSAYPASDRLKISCTALWLRYELLPSQMCQSERLIITWYRTHTCESSQWLWPQLIHRDHCLTLFDAVYLVCGSCHIQESVSMALMIENIILTNFL